MFDALGNALALLLSQFYKVTSSYGVSIVLLTVLVRLVLFPLTAKQMRSMQGMSRIQPELKKLQVEYKDDRMKLNEEMQALYRREGVNPVGSCLPMVFQIPVFIGLYNTIRGLSNAGRLAGLQIEVPKPKYLNPDTKMYESIVDAGGKMRSFGIDLAQSADVAGKLTKAWPYFLLIALYVVTAFFQQHLATKRNPTALTGPNAQVQQIMKWFPVLVAIFYYRMPAGLVLYFVASNLWTIAQQEILARKIPMVPVPAEEPSASKPTDSQKPGKITPAKVSPTTVKASPSTPEAPSVSTKKQRQQERQQERLAQRQQSAPSKTNSQSQSRPAQSQRKSKGR